MPKIYKEIAGFMSLYLIDGGSMELLAPAPKAELRGGRDQNRLGVVAVLGGKGGVGKTVVSTNLAAALASERDRVVLIDCDLSAGQSHILLGLCPSSGLAQVVRGEKKLREIALSAGRGLTLVPGGPSGGSVLDLRGEDLRGLVVEAGRLAPQARAVLLDAGPGQRAALGGFVDAADIALVVCTPEPTSIRATVAMLEVLFTERPEAKPHLLVNMATNEEDATGSYERIKDALLPVFTTGISLFGWLPYDLEVTRSLWRCRPVVFDTPRSRAARGLVALRESLEGLIGGANGASTALDGASSDVEDLADHDDSGGTRAA
jgi:flagellar biosynthesis protein FlhG